MNLTSRGRIVVGGLIAVILLLAVALIWRLGPGAPVTDQEIAHAQAYQATERLLEDEDLGELPAAREEELRDELQRQLEALGRPSERVLEAADERGVPVGVAPQDHVPGLPGAFLTSARMLVREEMPEPRQQAVVSSIAAHRAATALELGADPATVERAVPELTAQMALPEHEEGQEQPLSSGEAPHPELALARQLGQARSAAQTWSHLPAEQRPGSDRWARDLEPVADSDWLSALEQRHPSVIDGSPGMPEGFRSDSEAARQRLTDDLQDTALAQAAAAVDQGAEEPRSPSPRPGTAVVMSLAIADAAEGTPVTALPGLED